MLDSLIGFTRIVGRQHIIPQLAESLNDFDRKVFVRVKPGHVTRRPRFPESRGRSLAGVARHIARH